MRQYASRYLARAAAGETFEVTDRGRPVALLVPAPSDPWDHLVASRRIVVPSEEGDIADEAPVDYGVDASSRLAEMRHDDR